MKLGSDFYKWFQAFVAIIKVIIEIFGDNDDHDELKKNGIDAKI